MGRLKDNLYNIKELTKRNMLIFFKNQTTIFFSLIAPILILVLYVLFMGDMQVGFLRDNYPSVNLSDQELKGIINAWVISGIIGIASLTVALNSMFITISDKETKVINDFVASPVKQVNLTLSYFISAFIITFSLTLLFTIIGSVYLIIASGTMFVFTFTEVLLLLLTLILSTFSSVIILMFITSFFNKTSTAAAFTGIFTALIGFLIGAYLPVSFLPKNVASIANLIPGSQATSLFRNLFMNKILNDPTIINQVGIDFINQIKIEFGFNLYIFNFQLKPYMIILYLLATTIIFFFLNVIASKCLAKRK
ncbi:MAG TPA: ABC transporter permease [Candidatus Paceibacterota bacterium]|nr:ABC transporter permease [Candidatus Paceibacterota bacterium]